MFSPLTQQLVADGQRRQWQMMLRTYLESKMVFRGVGAVASQLGRPGVRLSSSRI